MKNTVPQTFPNLIAHRGACKEAPENTLDAFKKAIEIGASGVEFDILLTSDHELVLTHNNDLSILTNHEGFVHSTPYSIIKTLDFGIHFSPDFKNTRAPTLTEALTLLIPHNMQIICEIKSQPKMAYFSAKNVGEVISDFGFGNRIIISSTDPLVTFHLKRMFPKIKRAVILKKSGFPFFSFNIFDKYSDVSEFHCSVTMLNKKIVNKIHAKGKKIAAWTVDSAVDLQTCMDLKIDSLITNDVPAINAMINKLT